MIRVYAKFFVFIYSILFFVSFQVYSMNRLLDKEKQRKIYAKKVTEAKVKKLIGRLEKFNPLTRCFYLDNSASLIREFLIAQGHKDFSKIATTFFFSYDFYSSSFYLKYLCGGLKKDDKKLIDVFHDLVKGKLQHDLNWECLLIFSKILDPSKDYVKYTFENWLAKQRSRLYEKPKQIIEEEGEDEVKDNREKKVDEVEDNKKKKEKDEKLLQAFKEIQEEIEKRQKLKCKKIKTINFQDYQFNDELI